MVFKVFLKWSFAYLFVAFITSPPIYHSRKILRVTKSLNVNVWQKHLSIIRSSHPPPKGFSHAPLPLPNILLSSIYPKPLLSPRKKYKLSFFRFTRVNTLSEIEKRIATVLNAFPNREIRRLVLHKNESVGEIRCIKI